MTTISGDNVAFSATNFTGNKESIITRDGLTGNSTDVTPTAVSITDNITSPYTFSFVFYIYNASTDYLITLTSGTGFTMKPGPTDTIYPGTIKKYEVKILNQTTAEIYNMNYNGTGFNMNEALHMNSNNICNLSNPVSSQDATTKNYVDSGSWGTSAFPCLSAYEGTGTLSITNTLTPVPFDNTFFAPDTGLSIDTTTNVGQITVTNAGRYDISYSVVTYPIYGASGTRGRITACVQQDTEGGTDYTTITGSSSSGYMREKSGFEVTAYTCTKNIIVDITAGTTLVISFHRATGNVPAKLLINESSVTIRKVG